MRAQWGAVIVTWNSGDRIAACLNALPPETPAVVVDNASEDGTAALARGRATVIANQLNRGFAAAANQGIAALDCEFVLLLNPDTLVRSVVMPGEGVGAVGGRLVGEDGCTQQGFAVRGFPTPLALSFEILGLNRIWRGNPVNRRYRRPDFDFDRAQDADQPPGAFLLIRKKAWEDVDGFDERFTPVWFEDVDFCRRLVGAGWRIRYEPGAVAVHAGGASVKKLEDRERVWYWYANLLRYAGKHFNPLGLGLVRLAMLAAFLPRSIAGVLQDGSLRAFRTYGKVAIFALMGRPSA